jgi:hypothetical protein
MPSPAARTPSPPDSTASVRHDETGASAPAVDYSLRRYLLEGVEALTNVDSRLARSFRALIARPGELTRAYFSADREQYLRPLQIFLFCNVFYFFAQPLVGGNTLTSPLSIHLNETPYSLWARRVVAAEIQRRGVSPQAYALEFNAVIASHAKTLVIVLVPLFALVTAALLWRRRRYFVEHLVFSTHFIAFLLLALPPLLALVGVTLRAGLAWGGIDPGVLRTFLDAGPLFLMIAAYLWPALRRAYALPHAVAGTTAAALAFGMLLVLTAYRLVLFCVAFYTI